MSDHCNIFFFSWHGYRNKKKDDTENVFIINIINKITFGVFT